MNRTSFCQCGKPVLAKGLCSTCYHKQLRERLDHLCWCGKPISAKGLCSACYNRKRRRENPEIKRRDSEWSKRYRQKIQQNKPKKQNLFAIPFICSVCNREKKGSRRKTVYGIICTHCFKVLEEKKLVKDRLEHRDETEKGLIPFRDLLKDCNASGTCDIYALHHELLINDPQRLTTDFLIKLTCGDKYMKYQQKKDMQKKDFAHQFRWD